MARCHFSTYRLLNISVPVVLNSKMWVVQGLWALMCTLAPAWSTHLSDLSASALGPVTDPLSPRAQAVFNMSLPSGSLDSSCLETSWKQNSTIVLTWKGKKHTDESSPLRNKIPDTHSNILPSRGSTWKCVLSTDVMFWSRTCPEFDSSYSQKSAISEVLPRNKTVRLILTWGPF